PASVGTRLRRAPDRRLLHDGAARGRPRDRPARQPAGDPVPLRHVPGAARDARAAAGGSPRRADRAHGSGRHDRARVTIPVASYSIAACDLEAGQWGVATQSKFLAVGSVVPWAEPHVGAIATQAWANPRYGPEGLRLLREGRSAAQAVEELTAADEGRDHRQLGIVDAAGEGATHTGAECLD